MAARRELDGSPWLGASTGGGSFTQPSTLDATCNDWTTTEAQGRVGFSTFTTPGEFFQDSGTLSACDTSLFIACLEE